MVENDIIESLTKGNLELSAFQERLEIGYGENEETLPIEFTGMQLINAVYDSMSRKRDTILKFGYSESMVDLLFETWAAVMGSAITSKVSPQENKAFKRFGKNTFQKIQLCVEQYGISYSIIGDFNWNTSHNTLESALISVTKRNGNYIQRFSLPIAFTTEDFNANCNFLIEAYRNEGHEVYQQVDDMNNRVIYKMIDPNDGKNIDIKCQFLRKIKVLGKSTSIWILNKY